MPSTPYAKLLVSVNGAAAVDGGVDVPSEATLDFTAESTVGWLRCQWEIYDYPEGWATPAGWTLDASGTIYSNEFTPDQITLPANTALWGVWMPRLLVNEQLDDDQNELAGLIDQDVTAISMLSPSGLRCSGAREKAHFTTTTTLVKNWLRSFQRTLRVLEGLIVTGRAAFPIPALEIDWTKSQVFTKTLAAGLNTFTFANATSGMVISVRLTGAASTVAWPAGIQWPGGTDPVQTVSGSDIYTFMHDGTTIYGSFQQAFAT